MKFKLYLCYTLINTLGIIPDLYISVKQWLKEDKQ